MCTKSFACASICPAFSLIDTHLLCQGDCEESEHLPAELSHIWFNKVVQACQIGVFPDHEGDNKLFMLSSTSVSLHLLDRWTFEDLNLEGKKPFKFLIPAKFKISGVAIFGCSLGIADKRSR